MRLVSSLVASYSRNAPSGRLLAIVSHPKRQKMPGVVSNKMTTQTHYQGHSASSYESAFFYSPGGAYTTYLCQLVQDRLGLLLQTTTSRRRLLDIGGGTGNFTRMLLEGTTSNNHIQAIVVDPFLEASSQQEQETTTASNNDMMIQFIKADAESFASDNNHNEDDDWWKKDYHQVLMKEVVHHLDASHRPSIFRGIRQGLLDIEQPTEHDCGSSAAAPSLPSLLIITRPHRDIDYPLWNEAREVWASNQPSLQDLTQDLRNAGFARVDHTVEAYPCEIELERWLDMVRGRFWSTFSNFTDQELNEACQRIKRDEQHRIDDKGRIHFEDRLVFISAYTTV